MGEFILIMTADFWCAVMINMHLATDVFSEQFWRKNPGKCFRFCFFKYWTYLEVQLVLNMILFLRVLNTISMYTRIGAEGL